MVSDGFEYASVCTVQDIMNTAETDWVDSEEEEVEWVEDEEEEIHC